MRAVRLVGQHLHIMLVRDFDYRFYVRANSVICGVVDENCNRVGVVLNRLQNLFRLHTQGYAELCVHLRIDVNGNCPAQNERVYNRFMHVAGHYYFTALLADG